MASTNDTNASTELISSVPYAALKPSDSAAPTSASSADGSGPGGFAEEKSVCTWPPPRWAAILCVILTLAVILIIVLVFTLGVSGGSSHNDSSSVTDSESRAFFEAKFQSIPSNDSCYAYSKQFASKPHVAGTHQTRVLGQMFGEIMEELGYEVFFDDIEDAVLDHYNSSSLSVNNRPIDLAQAAIPGQNETSTAFRSKSGIAYTPSGDVTASLLYLNYGKYDDYERLQNEYGIDFNDTAGYIAVVRRYWPTLQAFYAAQFNIRGVIVFDDFFVENASAQYPNTPTLPNFAHRMDGRASNSRPCPGTPDVTRLEEQCGLNFSDSEAAEKYLFPAIYYDIPMMAVSPNVAIELFTAMKEEGDDDFNCTVPSEWETALPIDECIGGTDDVTAQMVTVNELHYDDTIQNVYGYLEGEEYPEEIVMIGAHRDAWGMGACDDISGTVTVLEIARSLSVLRTEFGWRPKRSLMFGSWDGEEWGLYGSVAFNEHDNEWRHRVVSYLNFDMTVVGGGLSLKGNPLYRELLLDTAKAIPYPYQQWTEYNHADDDANWTLFDSWWNFNASDDDAEENNLGMIVCNTDFCPFEFHSGVPTLGINFMGDFSMATTYHTLYDLNGWLDVVDPQWDFAESIATFGGLLMLKIAQQDLLPFDVVRLALKMEDWALGDLSDHIDDVELSGNCTFNSTDTAMAVLEESIGTLIASATDFEAVYNATLSQIEEGGDDDDALGDRISSINGVLKNVMKRLLNSEGTPGAKWYKQLLWGNWGTTKFPFIWSYVSDGCEADDVAEFEEAFGITVGAINNVSALLQSVA